VLLTNNIRDIPTDGQSGKRTLAVRMGAGPARTLYVGTIIGAFALVIPIAISTGAWTYLAFAAVPLSIKPMRIVLGGTTGPGLIPALKATGTLVLVFGLVLAIGIALNQ
jgi:1,4-dihydroxy-2-naphthoate octaprenyltransferase